MDRKAKFSVTKVALEIPIESKKPTMTRRISSKVVAVAVGPFLTGVPSSMSFRFCFRLMMPGFESKK